MTLDTEMLGEGASDTRRLVHVERDQTRAVLTLCDPERLNPLSAGLTMQLQAHLMDLAADPSLSSEYSSAEHSSAQGWPRRAHHGRHRGTVRFSQRVGRPPYTQARRREVHLS